MCGVQRTRNEASTSQPSPKVRELLLQPLEAADQKRRSKVALTDVWKQPGGGGGGGGHAAERKRGAGGQVGAGSGEPSAQRAKT